MKSIITLLLLTTSILQAQYTIKVTMDPPKKDDWIILYKTEGTKLNFVKNTTVKKETISVGGKKKTIGKFEFTLPKDSKTGAYRINYSLEDGGFVDFLFNREDVEFTFNPQLPEESVVYTQSKENKLYDDYLKDTYAHQQVIDLLQNEYFQNPSESLKKQYRDAVKKQAETEKAYLSLSKGMLVNHFIIASHRFNSKEVIGDMQKYLESVMSHFFDSVDFKNPFLYNSSFLIDKITDYIFYLNYSDSKPQQQKLYKASIAVVIKKITDLKFKKDIIEFLIKQFAQKENVELVDTLFTEYYDKLAASLQNKKFKEETLTELASAVGRVAPDFSWKEGKNKYTLFTLDEAKTYLLVFWSANCSHCIREIPLVYKYMKKHPKTKVIALGLEEKDEKVDWQNYIPRLSGWHHALELGKWKNPIVKKYQVFATPSYFILDSQKKIIAKPYGLKEIKKYYDNKGI